MDDETKAIEGDLKKARICYIFALCAAIGFAFTIKSRAQLPTIIILALVIVFMVWNIRKVSKRIKDLRSPSKTDG